MWRRDGAAGSEDAAADRRRDDQPRAYRGEDRSELPQGQPVYVNDASRAVGVASSLLSPEKSVGYAAEVRADYAKIARRISAPSRTRSGCRSSLRGPMRMSSGTSATRRCASRPSSASGLSAIIREELAAYIDWTPFFQTWELSGRFPGILTDERRAKRDALYADAQKMLKQIIEEKWFTAKATIGFWPANAVGDDIRLYADDSRSTEIATLYTLRQQLEKREGRQRGALGLRRAEVECAGLYRRLRRHRGHRRGHHCRSLQERQ
jgi:5-methyltetrahydrofolate--homocysteine methyltransferase